MKLAEIAKAALSLPDRDRASLASQLHDTLPASGMDVTDD